MNEFEKLKKTIGLALREFSGDIPVDTEFWRLPSNRQTRDDFPVPELVLIVLRDVMGFPSSGRGEKVRWSVYCLFRGIPFSFELRKFGFTVRCPDAGSSHLDAALGLIKKAIRQAEDLFQVMAREQAGVGNVTLANRFVEFDARYRFFRGKAEEAYVKPDPPLKRIQRGEGGPISWEGVFMQGPREGSYYSAAMVDAYFNRLEHCLVLVLPFVNFDPADGELLQFNWSNWSDKFKTAFDVNGDATAKRLYDRIRGIKERLRNPLAHGGFEKGSASLFFHFPGVGALPANLSGFRDSVYFNFLPVDFDDHRGMCILFDEVDALFGSGRTQMGYQYLTSGLDVSFDQASRKAYREAMKSAGTLQEFIRQQHYLADGHANMDY